MMEHLRKHFPRKVADFDDMGLAEQIHQTLLRAYDHGYTSHADCARYLGLAAALGWSFDDDIPWVRQSLTDGASEPTERLAQIHQRAIRMLRRGPSSVSPT
ncbi:MAG: hypothetical protein AAF799_01930 [Myxococcota bacterium]